MGVFYGNYVPNIFDEDSFHLILMKRLGKSWARFFPFTLIVCLLDVKVWHKLVVLPDGTIAVKADPQMYVLIDYKRENKEAVATINQYGNDDEPLLIKGPELTAQQKKKITTVTVPLLQDYNKMHFSRKS